MRVRDVLVRLGGDARAVENARTACRELSRLRLEREAVELFLADARAVHADSRIPEPRAAEPLAARAR